MIEAWENRNLEDLDGEIWKEIEGYGGDYFISNLGRVKSFKGIDVRILKQNDDKGYLVVSLCKNGKEKTSYIHILMYTHFIGLIPKGFVIHHRDFTKNNNILENFQLLDDKEHKKLHNKGENHPMYGKYGKENPFYGKKHSEKSKKLMSEHTDNKGEHNPMFGIHRYGEESGYHILTEKKVIQIRRLCDEGNLTQKEIGKMFGVDQTTISKIKLRKIWKHI